MLGFLMIHRGPPNEICDEGGFPKITELLVGYSRDGFHFDRRDRTPDRRRYPSASAIGTATTSTPAAAAA